MASKAFTPSVVRNELRINLCCTAKERMCKPQSTTENRGDILSCGLWEQGTDCILDVRVTDTDAKTYEDKKPHKVLESAEKLKKRKYSQP
jgi:hypothetical protein